MTLHNGCYGNIDDNMNRVIVALGTEVVPVEEGHSQGYTMTCSVQMEQDALLTPLQLRRHSSTGGEPQSKK